MNWKNLKLSVKMTLPSALALVLLIIILVIASGITITNLSEEFISKQANSYIKNMVVNQTDFMNRLYDQLKKEGADEETIKNRLIELTDISRYGESGYFWINDFRPFMVHHPIKPGLNNTDLSDFKDPEGVFLFNEMAEVCKTEGEGYVRYMWEMPGKDKPQPKISFVKTFEPYQWVVGSGEYTENITRLILTENKWIRGFKQKSIFFTLTMALLIIIALIFFMRYRLKNDLLRPLAWLQKTFIQIQKNKDLQVDIRTYSTDEIGMLRKSIKDLVQFLNDLFNQLRESADILASSSTQLSSSSEELSATSKEQSKQAQFIAGSMDEFQNTIEDNQKMIDNTMDKIGQTDELVRDSSNSLDFTIQSIKKIMESTNRLTTEVEELKQSAQDIGNILGVITDISDQTNLLALNAAIEAARAGDAGRGFAVVADEVRKLAERTVTSTKEIEEIIHRIDSGTDRAITAMNETNREVKTGMELSGKAQSMNKKVTQSAQEVAEFSESVSAATTEQAASVVEVNQNIQGMNESFQQIESTTGEVSATAQALSEQAENLKTLIEGFKIKPK